jgi:hypothetical protein
MASLWIFSDLLEVERFLRDVKTSAFSHGPSSLTVELHNVHERISSFTSFASCGQKYISQGL